MPLYNVTCKIECDELYKLQNGDFQLVSGGDVAPLMIGYDYVLAEKSLAKTIVNLATNISRVSVSIIRRSTNEVLVNHELLIVKDSFSVDGIAELNTEGCHCYILDKAYLFVTPQLKEILLDDKYNFLKFTQGLSWFA